jgi:cephalosporin hydroxylase
MKLSVHIDQHDLEEVAAAYYDRVLELEDAGKRVVAACKVDRYYNKQRWCLVCLDTTNSHTEACPVGALARLLEDA